VSNDLIMQQTPNTPNPGRLLTRSRAAMSPRRAARPTEGRFRDRWGFLIGLASFMALLLAAPGSALAAESFQVISTAGTGAGHTIRPEGLAVDRTKGRLYVADSGNNRVDVFDTSGTFLKAFGWGVKTGAAELQSCTSTCQPGIAGEGSGQFQELGAVAVDNNSLSPSFHDLYVVDPGNSRIEKFDEEGQFILTFGGGVNKTTSGDVCAAASGDVCGKGSEGTSEGEFSPHGALDGAGTPISVVVGPGGEVLVVDSFRVGTEEAYRVQEFESTGALKGPPALLHQGDENAASLAVDADGNLYVSSGGGAQFGVRVRKFEAMSLEETGQFTVNNLSFVGIDASGNLFSTEGPYSVAEFGAPASSADDGIRRFAYGIAQNGQSFSSVAPYSTANGDVYVSEGGLGSATDASRVLYVRFPPPGPLVLPGPCAPTTLKSTSAVLGAKINPEGAASNYQFEYVTQAHFETEGFANAAATEETSLDAGAADIEMHSAAATATGLAPETTYRCRVTATNADGSTTGEEGSFKTKAAFEFGRIFASEVGTETAIVNAVVNPLGSAAEAQFEYVDDAAFRAGGFAAAKLAPAVPIQLAGDEDPTTLSATLSGLSPQTTYHYRLRVKDSFFPTGVICPGEEGEPAQENICKGRPPTFRTFGPGEGLPDGRAYELVSPAEKNSAEVGVPGRAGGLGNERFVVLTQAAATNGQSVTYTSWTSFGDAEGAPSASQYLSRRTGTGWSTENISPFGFEQNPLNPPFRGFSPDLSYAGLAVSEPALAPGALRGFENLYRRDNVTRNLEALTGEPAPAFTPVNLTGLEYFCSSYAGSSSDGSRSFFAANGAFPQAGAPAGTGFSLYERSPSGLALISTLPDGTPAPPAPRTRFGNEGGFCTMDQGIVANAVSRDGSKAFWSFGGSYATAVNGEAETVQEPLFAHLDGTGTVELDVRSQKEGKGKFGTGPSGRGTFWGATPDGSQVFFTAPGKLLPVMSAEGALYRYDTDTRTLSLLTPTTISPHIEGVIGISEDGSYVYFVAATALTGAEEAAGETALEGAKNLYVWHDGTIRFIARLSEEDEAAWTSSPEGLTGRVSPDGRHLAFLTTEAKALSGYDNTRPGGEPCKPNQNVTEGGLEGNSLCPEAYLYDAEARTLSCVSCNPSGARPEGPAQLPSWSNPFEGPRDISANGNRMFFETRDSLSPADENGKRDVYEFERAGIGSCTTANPSFAVASGGCIVLISSGHSEDETFFLDASADGHDVFFSTREPLVGWDTNPNYDVYDARVGGGFAEPVSPPSLCAGEDSCRQLATSPPLSPTFPTSTFSGSGNPKPKKAKHKKKHGHHHGKKRHKHKKKRRAHHDKRRAAR